MAPLPLGIRWKNKCLSKFCGCVLEQPSAPRIFDAEGHEIRQDKDAGPFFEDQELFLECQVRGGRFVFKKLVQCGFKTHCDLWNPKDEICKTFFLFLFTLSI
jgi:hypothetical protein